VVLSVWSAAAVFAVAAIVTVYASTKLAQAADILADRFGVGEALFGAVFFGAVTSLSGIVMTATVAHAQQPGLAYSNAVGGIAAQTVALAVIDLCYREANLEHAAASLPNLMFGLLLIVLLSLVLLIGLTPSWTVLGVHPACAMLLGAYGYGLRLVRQVDLEPAWRAHRTPETRIDVPEPDRSHHGTRALVISFAATGLLVSLCGWAIAHTASALVQQTELSDSVVGVLLMGGVNAAPEAITGIAAVRRGALTLAVAGVLGGNAFDVLNLVVGDIAYRDGSLFHAARAEQSFVTVLAITLTAIVLMGLVRRQPQGLAGIGFESVLLLVVYAGGMIVLVATP
jgi:cation:H+ antiporter